MMMRTRLAAIFLVALVALSGHVLRAQSCNSVAGDIGGLLFQDYDLDGTRDPAEPVVRGEGIQVVAYDCNNAVLGSAAVSTNGTYRLAGIGSANGVRVELANLPAWLVESCVGSNARTSVRFVTGGNCAVDFGVSEPGNYCGTATPNLITTCFVEGPYNGSFSALPALVRVPFAAAGTNVQHTYLANHADIGAAYGLAWQRGTRRLYVGAFHKRYSGFGPGGADAIYVLNASGAVQGTIKLGNLVGGAGAGADVHNFTLLPSEDTLRDDASFGQVGKVGLGDLEIADDDRTLYVVNLANRRIYALDVTAGTAGSVTIVNSWAAPDGCGDGTHRPMGLEFHKGRLYVGSVCENGLTGFVHSLNPATGAFTLELTVPLNYNREVVAQTTQNAPPQPPSTAANWRAWTDNPTDFFYTFQGTNFEIAWPQPMLSDIAFDGEDMILGFRDRFGDQSGTQVLHVPVASGTVEKPSSRFYTGNAAGDTLRVGRIGSTWTLETGLAGTVSAQEGAIGPQPNSGPGGHEYYYWDFYYSPYNLLPSVNVFTLAPATPGNTANNYHLEVATGALVQLPGLPYVFTTAVDPQLGFSGGLLRFSNLSGQRWGVSADDIANTQAEFDLGGYTIFQSYRRSLNNPLLPATFGKANGLGDLIAICDPAPQQIGNRVFRDLDADGVQDPCDPPISQVTVLLYSNGVQIASTVTGTEGEYYFNNGNVPAGIAPRATYQVRINRAQTALTGLLPTLLTVPAATSLHNSDGNAALNAGFVTAPVTTGNAGVNDHNFDFGFVAPACIGNQVWFDRNRNGTQDGGAENGVGGVTVYLRDANGRVATNQTNSAGLYEFCNLFPGDYCVEFDLSTIPSGYAPTVRGVTGASDPADSDGSIQTGKTEFTTLVSGENDPSWDLGLVCLPPVITCPPTAVVHCPDSTLPAATGTATAVSPCGCALTITFADTAVATCGTTREITRTWTATDDCGNATSCQQIIRVVDTLPPTLAGVPANTSVSCEVIPVAPTVTAADTCDASVPVTFSQISQPGSCPNSSTIIRTWAAQDDCGNRVEQSQVITVTDTTPPTLFGVPANTTVECNALPTAPGVFALDNCDPSVTPVLAESVEPGNCPSRYVLVRTWTATDDCQNQSRQSQRITVQDTQSPILQGVPANQTVECNALPTPPAVTASDNCDNNLTVDLVTQTIPGTCPGRYTLIRTWSTSDDCGNPVSQSQVITVQDTTAPVLTGVPTNATVACNAVPSAPTVTAVDACDPTVPVTFQQSITPGNCPGSYTINRSWSATDDCGNPVNALQVITVQDLLPPVLAGVPTNVTVACTAVPTAPVVTALDNCDTGVTVVPGQVIVPGACPSSYTIVRTWNATDNCGNPASATQVITVQDLLPPVIAGVPANATVPCTAVPAAPTLAATDNCDLSVPVTFSQIITPGACSGRYTITRSWSATDDCANTVNLQQVITVEDNLAPVLTGVPANASAACNALPTAPTVTAADNCGPVPTVQLSQQTVPGNCPDSYSLIRTWTAADDCGNSVSSSQVITVTDTQNPVLVGVPAGATVPCTAIPNPPTVTGTDNCDTAVSVTLSEQTIPGTGEGNYTLRRTWTAVDNCGNQSTGSQDLLVRDTVAPVLSGVPGNLNLGCDPIPTPPLVTASDNCDTTPAIGLVETPTANGLVRRWTATDDSGNSSSASQTITTTCNVAIGNLVWKDLDGDGQYEPGSGEAGIPGVTVQLYSAGQTPGVVQPLRSMLTDNAGRYRFDGLTPGCYLVHIPTPPGECTTSSGNTDTVDNREDNDDNGTQTAAGAPTVSPVVCLAIAAEPTTDGDDANGDLTVDFGFYAPVTVGNLVWHDLDADGCQEPGEPGIPGVLVTLYNADNNQQVRSTTTGNDGTYLFSGLPPGRYFVDFALSPDWLSSPRNASACGDTLDSDPDAGGITPPTAFLPSGAQDLTLDAGCYRLACLGDTVWIDIDRNSLPNENLAGQGVSGVVVNLYRVTAGGNVFLRSAVTTVNGSNRGFYEFCELPPDEYCVIVDPSNVPAGFEVPTTVQQYKITLRSGDNGRLQDFGFISIPTAVELSAFTAARSGSGVVIAWTTGSETGNLGFNVHRSTRINGQRSPVNTMLVEGQGSGSGADYAMFDAGAPLVPTYYWLEDVDADGTRTFHGPVRVAAALAAAESAEVESAPVNGLPVLAREAADCLAPWVTAAEANWLLGPFGFAPAALDITNPAQPLRRRGQQLGNPGAVSLYLRLPAEARILVVPEE